MATVQEIESFAQFAREQVHNGGADLSLDELMDMWRALNPTQDELAESVAAVKAALADMEAGDCGIPAEELLAKLRRKYNIPADE